MSDVAVIALAAWSLTWAVSFWHKTTFLREWLGVYFVYDDDGEPIDRVDAGGLGSWVNCPLCAAIPATVVGVAAFHLFEPLAVGLAGLGLTLLIVRWWEGAREKARWWT